MSTPGVGKIPQVGKAANSGPSAAVPEAPVRIEVQHLDFYYGARQALHTGFAPLPVGLVEVLQRVLHPHPEGGPGASPGDPGLASGVAARPQARHRRRHHRRRHAKPGDAEEMPPAPRRPDRRIEHLRQRAGLDARQFLGRHHPGRVAGNQLPFPPRVSYPTGSTWYRPRSVGTRYCWSGVTPKV